jgi:hypothetical protein
MGAILPPPGTGTRQIVMAVYNHGPIRRLDLYKLLDAKSKARRNGVLKALEGEWMMVDDFGRYEVTPSVRKHLDDLAAPVISVVEEPKYEGVVAGPNTIQPMKAKPYVPPKRFMRVDVPDWSKRPEGFGFKTALGTKGVEL